MLIISISVKAQNLVPNPSFEEYTTCPGGDSELYFTKYWKNYGASPDYYNSCCLYLMAAGVPNNFCGHQYAQDGNAYAGIGGTFDTRIRELIGIQLLQPLVIGKRYYVSFYASLTLNPSYAMNVAFNKLGVKFLTTNFTDSIYPNLLVNNEAQVYSNSIITDSVGWTNITGSFIADSAYQYMAVGFFFDSIHLNFIKFFDCQANYFNYYLDNFYVGTTPSNASLLIKNSLNIFPTLANDFVYINGIFDKLPEIVLYDFYGNEIPVSINKSQNFFQLNVSNLNNSIYFLKITTNEKSFSKKIIINH